MGSGWVKGAQGGQRCEERQGGQGLRERLSEMLKERLDDRLQYRLDEGWMAGRMIDCMNVRVRG